MKTKSQIIREAMPKVLNSTTSQYICHNLGNYYGANGVQDLEEEKLCEEIRDDIYNITHASTFKGYMIHRVGIQSTFEAEDNINKKQFIQFLRVKFMETVLLPLYTKDSK